MSGGIGFARHFIQKLAEDFGLPYIFMMDDNVRHVFEVESKISAETGEDILVRNNGHMVTRNIPLSKVLQHLEVCIPVPPGGGLLKCNGEHHLGIITVDHLKSIFEK